MAHSGKTISVRIFHLDGQYDEHEQGGSLVPPSGLLFHSGHNFMAVRDALDHGPFHLRRVVRTERDGRGLPRTDSVGYIHLPLHPDQTFADIDGATYAYDDGTYWRFAHCSPGEQIQFAADARAFTFNQFLPALIRANTALGRGGVGAAAAADKARALTDFAEQAANAAFDVVRFKTLGHYHRDPHRDHKRELAVAAMDRVTAAWAQNAGRVSDRARVQNTVVILRAQLVAGYDIDWRHERARSDAARGRDPVDGREYCFTLSATADAITGDANLPDPDWNFDDFPAQGLVRGTQTYYDREPSATEPLPFIVRFGRSLPTPEPAKGASIGTVAWDQDEAYRGAGQ